MSNDQTTARKDVAIIMGSVSDKVVMQGSINTLKKLGVSYRAFTVSAHRTPDWMFEFVRGAQDAGYKVIIAGAGGSAHLPGMAASLTDLPVLGVPVPSASHPMNDTAAVMSMLQMPAGTSLATFPLGSRDEKNAGAIAAALAAAKILALNDTDLRERIRKSRADMNAYYPLDCFIEES